MIWKSSISKLSKVVCKDFPTSYINNNETDWECYSSRFNTTPTWQKKSQFLLKINNRRCFTSLSDLVYHRHKRNLEKEIRNWQKGSASMWICMTVFANVGYKFQSLSQLISCLSLLKNRCNKFKVLPAFTKFEHQQISCKVFSFFFHHVLTLICSADGLLHVKENFEAKTCISSSKS